MAEIPLSDEDDAERARMRREYLRQNPPLAKPIGPFYCWGCNAQMRSLAEGQSLAANDTLHICNRCWEALTIVERIQLGFLFRPSAAGGLGARESLAKLSRGLDFVVDNGLPAMDLLAEILAKIRESGDADDDDSEAWKHG